ncbi:SDR family oxidoreductase [Ramlibacter sp. MMS24-I3-19]|uniref:SDR family oxidoreductase n=1 Tax=Ramlibacter sp. MMS24-I3-19 TaxID=3416606 RepID=UPI003D048B12
MSPWVLVTGGARRLGREVSLAFGRAGWKVACHYRESGEAAQTLAAELGELGVQCALVRGPLDDADAARRVFEQVRRHAGPSLRCIVNNASEFVPDSAAGFDAAGLVQRLQTNLVVPLEFARLLAQAAGPTQDAGERPSVVHILDQKVYNLNPDYFSYTLSKLALERAVAQQAQALAPVVRVNAVAPGLLYPSGPQTQQNFDAAATANLLREPIQVPQVAQAVLFLAMNPCITGASLCVDNGQHLVPLPRDIMFVVDELLGKVGHGQHA